jgi:hypothetical protein
MAEDATTTTDNPADQNVGADQATQDDTLGDAGKKALEAERRNARAAAKERDALAVRLKEFEDRDKSGAEKAQDRIKGLENELSVAQRESLRFKVASKFSIGAEDADLFLTGIDEDTLTKQAERLSARNDERKRQGNYVPREGAPSGHKNSPGGPAQDFADFLGSQLGNH